MQRIRIVIYSYAEIVFFFPEVKAKARQEALRVLEISSAIPDEDLDRKCKKQDVHFFRDGTYFDPEIAKDFDR